MEENLRRKLMMTLESSTNSVLMNYSDFDNRTNNSLSDSSTELYPVSLVIPFTIVYSMIFVTGVVGNVSTCIVIAKNKSMHTATNYYLFSMAISDMLLLISGLPPEMYRIWSPNNYVFGEIFCVLQGFAAETSANATVLTITAFTVERYLAICHPFLSHTMSKLSRVIRSIISIWIIALCLAVPQAIQFGILYTGTNSHCTVVSNSFQHAFEISTFVFFVGPMTLITALYVFIGVQLRKSKNIAGAQRPSLASSRNSESRRRILRHTAAQNRVVKMLIAVVAAFFICWAPFHAQRLLAVYLSTASTEDQNTFMGIYTVLMYTSGVLYFLSTTINPLLYHIMSNKYRKAFKKTFNICNRKHPTPKTYRVLEIVTPALRPMQRSVSEGVEAVTYKTNKVQQNGKQNDFLDNRRFNRARSNSKSSRSSDISTTSRVESYDSQTLNKSRYLFQMQKTTPKQPNLASQNKIMFNVFGLSLVNIFHRQKGFQSNFSNRINRAENQSANSANTISNSSLQDLDDTEFTSIELIKYMQEVNDKL